MKNVNGKEILLLLNTRFLVRNWLAQKNHYEQKETDTKDQLKEACWNGLVQDILPECFENRFEESGYLWDINEAKSFVGLDYSLTCPAKEKFLSLDPYIFLSVQGLN